MKMLSPLLKLTQVSRHITRSGLGGGTGYMCAHIMHGTVCMFSALRSEDLLRKLGDVVETAGGL